MTTISATVNPAWITQALCRGRPPEWWDVGDDGNRLAMTLCRACPIRALCPQLDAAPTGVVHAGNAYDDNGQPCRICPCGQPIVGRTADPNMCPACAPMLLGQCAHCARLYHRSETQPHQKYCTPRCQHLATEQRRRERRKQEKATNIEWRTAVCALPECGQTFKVDTRSAKRYCSTQCRQKVHDARKAERHRLTDADRIVDESVVVLALAGKPGVATRQVDRRAVAAKMRALGRPDSATAELLGIGVDGVRALIRRHELQAAA